MLRTCHVSVRLGGALAALIASAALTATPAGAVIGGQSDSTAGDAVFIASNSTSPVSHCSGAIIDATHVIAPATCITAGPPFVADVWAGTTSIVKGSGQTVAISSFRVHPGHANPANQSFGADDIEVLTLAAPLTLGGTAVALPLAAAGTLPDNNALVRLDGFGNQTVNVVPPVRTLNGLPTAVYSPGVCGGQVRAVLLCTTSATGSACNFDWGAPLIYNGTLIGIYQNGQTGKNCEPGSINFFTYLAAPEILQFIQGNDTPPTAPRITTDPVISVPTAAVGQTATCAPPALNPPATSIQYFFFTTTSAILQNSGPSATYTLRDPDVGATVECGVRASNAGGGLIAGSKTIGPIASTPLRLRVRIRKAPKTVHRGHNLTGSYEVTADRPVPEKVRFCISGPRKIISRQSCKTAPELTTDAIVKFSIKIPHKAPTGTAHITITASASGIVSARAHATLSVRIKR